MKNMEIILSRHAGFCGGVNRAYNMIRKAAADSEVKKPIFVLGDLVHNKDVVENIGKLGVKKIEIPRKLEALFNNITEKIGTLVITAHGMGPKIYKLAKEKGVNLIDTTCPKVIRVQRLAKNFSESESSCQLIVIGDRGHKEVEGICEWANGKAIVAENKKDLKNIKLNSLEKIVVISQTTQDKKSVDKIFEFIKKKYDKVETVDTICMATQNRQNEARKLAKNSDAVIIVGSPTSANSARLWEISKKINPKSHFIERAEDIKKEWFKNCRKIGVTAGASSPDWVIKDVIKCLKNLKK